MEESRSLLWSQRLVGLASFAVSETKQEIFDFAVDHQHNLMSIEPGTYQMRGFFEDHVTAPLTFVVRP